MSCVRRVHQWRLLCGGSACEYNYIHATFCLLSCIFCLERGKAGRTYTDNLFLNFLEGNHSDCSAKISMQDSKHVQFPALFPSVICCGSELCIKFLSKHSKWPF